MIGGLEPCSFIDFPGCLSAVVFLRGCNLRCPYCHNVDLLNGDGPSLMGEDDLLTFLSSRRERLDGVVFSGGEPTLYSNLRAIIEAARSLGYKVKLDTNGTRPKVLSELFIDKLLDYVALDYKDEPASYTEWLRMRESPEVLQRSLEIVKTSEVDHELRTTVVWPYHDEKRLDRMARMAVGCRRWILQPCWTVANQSSSSLNLTRDAILQEIASQIREKHGINCCSRSERDLNTH